MHYRIGTRASKLALWQAEYIKGRLEAAGHTAELVLFETKGDKQLEVTIAKIGSKGVFTEELENGLLEGSLDLAVHSAKDLQSTMPDGLELIAFTEREQVHDVVLSLNKELDLTKAGLVVGSSSTRRRAMLARHYPNITAVEARGNLQTRLQKLKDGQFEAMLLAYAGVHRMGFEEYIVHHLPTDKFIPPTGQGSVAVQAGPAMFPDQKEAVRDACNDYNTELCLLAERAYLAVLNGGCSIPVFANAVLTGHLLKLKAGIISLDGTQLIEENIIATLPTNTNAHVVAVQELGRAAAEAVIKRGGMDILNSIRQGLA